MVFRDVINCRQLLQKSYRANHLQCSHQFCLPYDVNDIRCKHSASAHGCQVVHIYVGVLMYADDQLLISSACSDLHRMTKICENVNRAMMKGY